MNDRYIETVRLLLDIAPVVFKSGDFAMKGGTAINLFVRNMPRLSVDIDLVFIDVTVERDKALETISQRLEEIRTVLNGRGIQVPPARNDKDERRLLITRGKITVKVEVNQVFRGTVLPVVQRDLCPKAQETFSRNITLPILDPQELYASKLVAALDRQHPRDLFDVLMLRQNEGISDQTRQAFVAYLSGHNRPINELLPPNPVDISTPYHNDFVGMTTEDVALNTLLETRQWLFSTLPGSLTANERSFLISLKNASPDWALISIPHLKELPAVAWKLKNIHNLKTQNARKHEQSLKALVDKIAALPPVE